MTSTGVRLAVVQTAILLGACAVDAGLARPVIHNVLFHDAEAHVRAEADALAGEFAGGGRERVAASIAVRSRRSDGVYYRLDSSAGRQLAGSLPAPPIRLGLSFIDGDDLPNIPNPILRQDIVVYAEPLPNGDVVTAGEALGARNQLQTVLLRNLWWTGLAAAAVGLLVSWLIYRGAVGRIDALAGVAREAALGRLETRVPLRKTFLPDDIDDLSQAVNHMLGRINVLMQNVRQVSADIAHDLRTPLTRVSQKLDAIRRRHPETPGLAADIEGVGADLAEALRTFDAMLRLAEIENQAGPPSASIDLAHVVQQVAEAYRPDAEDSGRRLEVSAAPAPIAGDPDLIVQMVANLLDNALRHTPPGSRIVLTSVLDAEGRACLSVADNGPGIAPPDRAKALERFVRLDPSRSGAGAGLGLAIVAAIAQRHGASLELLDRTPGLEVRLRFPAIEPSRPGRAHASHPPAQQGATT